MYLYNDRAQNVSNLSNFFSFQNCKRSSSFQCFMCLCVRILMWQLVFIYVLYIYVLSERKRDLELGNSGFVCIMCSLLSLSLRHPHRPLYTAIGVRDKCFDLWAPIAPMHRSSNSSMLEISLYIYLRTHIVK